MTKLITLLKEDSSYKQLFIDINWEEVARLIGGKFIHKHKDQCEAEIQVGEDHLLLELHEDNTISLDLIKPVTKNIFLDIGENREISDPKIIAKSIQEFI